MYLRNWRIFLNSLISVRWKRGIPRLVIHEKYEKVIKRLLRIIACAGLLSSIITFQTWYISFSVAVALFLIEQFFEKSIFQYTTIYIQPMPDFKYIPEEWKGIAFAFPVNPNPRQLNVVGCAFGTEEYARKFFKLIKAWNYDKKVDTENNICLSFIIENEEKYSVYLYPNIDRKTVDQFFEKAEENQRFKKYGKEHQQLVMNMVFCKIFPYGKDSQLMQFINKQSLNRPFWLKPFIMKGDGSIEMIYSEEPILKYHYKFKKRRELLKNEFEYQHGQHVMGKN